MMCGTCGCGEGHVHIDGEHHHGGAREIALERDIMAKNNGFADTNRKAFQGNRILALNLVSSPGAGKTELLVKTIEALHTTYNCFVIEGDQQTSHDADRIRATGAPAVQINTGKGCHLDAHMIGHAVQNLSPEPDGILFIENVGNLVCPAGFDLGEAHKVVVLSVTEGEDKPLKYPDMFAAADLALINKADLLPYLDVDIDLMIANLKRVNPRLEIIQISAKTGEGMRAWSAWISAARAVQHPQKAAE